MKRQHYPLRNITIATVFCAILFGLSLEAPAQANWETNIQRAVDRAAGENRRIFLLFTGEGWCPYCEVLEKDYLSKSEFLSYAGRNLVLLKVNLPNYGDLNPQQKALKSFFKLRGVPTVWMLESDVTPLFRASRPTTESVGAFIGRLQTTQSQFSAADRDSNRQALHRTLRNANITLSAPMRGQDEHIVTHNHEEVSPGFIEYPYVKVIRFPNGADVIDAPILRPKLLKEIYGTHDANVKGHIDIGGIRYYVSDWSWDRFKQGISPNWMRAR